MGKALYRKYRSKKLDEIVGQPHITDTLKNALEQGTYSHAYLFTGPRGTGKTSIARILAHELNNLPYEDESTHLDIIEIDAASNRRIDEIRELRERVHTAPTSARYKVYIIDEVHMLTKEAFNALLKTLEEPPAHVIFILATTEAHKLPETIISRTQRFTFKPVQQDIVVGHLKHIAKQEKLSISDDALALIAQHGGGSFRDSISLLDQIRGRGGDITLHDVEAMLGIAPAETIDRIVAALQAGQVDSLLTELQTARQNGYYAGQLAKQLASRLRQGLLEGVSPLSANLVTNTLEKLVSVPAAYDPEAALEIALLDVALNTGNAAVQTLPVQPGEPVTITDKLVSEKPSKKAADIVMPSVTVSAGTLDAETWQQILEAVKQSNNTLYSVARMATPKITGDELTLEFAFAFHQKRLNETKNKQIISDVAAKVVGRPVAIICVVSGVTESFAPRETPATPEPSGPQDDTISTISNIFGGAELLD